MRIKESRVAYENLTGIYLERYRKNKREFIRAICNVDVPAQILLIVYGDFIDQGILSPMEELPKKEKEALFLEYKNADMVTSKEKAIEVCKIIYTLEFIKNNI
jgi:hypothetical protein